MPIKTWELPSRRSIQVRHVPTWPTWPCTLCRPGHFCATSSGGASPCCEAICIVAQAKPQLHWLSAIAILNFNLSSHFLVFLNTFMIAQPQGNALLRNLANFDHRTRKFVPVSTLKGFTPHFGKRNALYLAFCAFMPTLLVLLAVPDLDDKKYIKSGPLVRDCAPICIQFVFWRVTISLREAPCFLF